MLHCANTKYYSSQDFQEEREEAKGGELSPSTHIGTKHNIELNVYNKGDKAQRKESQNRKQGPKATRQHGFDVLFSCPSLFGVLIGGHVPLKSGRYCAPIPI